MVRVDVVNGVYVAPAVPPLLFDAAGEKIAQGREKVKAYLQENPAVAEEFERAIRDKMLRVPKEPSLPDAGDVDGGDGEPPLDVVELEVAEEDGTRETVVTKASGTGGKAAV